MVEASVLRRFSQFLWLVERLGANNPGVIVPPVPDKQISGACAVPLPILLRMDQSVSAGLNILHLPILLRYNAFPK